MFRKTIVALAAWLASGVGLPAWSATVLETSEVRAANAAAAAQLPPTYEFTLTAAGNYVVTLKDLGVMPGLPVDPTNLNVPVLQSLQVLVTRDLQAVAELEIDYPTEPNIAQLPETQVFAGTPGTYRVHVLGAASDAGVGLFSVDVAPSGGGAPLFQVADEIAIQSGPAPEQTVLQTSFTVTQAGAYRVRALDRSFPAPLVERNVLVLQTSPTVGVVVSNQGAFSTADVGTFNATAGATYDLIVIASSSGADAAGLYGVSVQGGPSDAVIYRSENAVGSLPRARTLSIASAGAHTLTLADLEFPEALTSFSAAVIQNETFVGSTTGTTAANLTLSAGPAQLFVYAVTPTVGAASVTLGQGAQVEYADVHIADASPEASTPAIYSFSPSEAVAAGNYMLTLADLRFPTQLTDLRAAVVQGATVVHQLDEAGSEPVTLQTGRMRVLVAATPPPVSGTTPGNGLFALTLTTQPGNATVIESTQGVGGLFTARVVTLPAAGRYDVTLKDFAFPERLRTSWLAVTRGTTLVGQVIGSSAIQNLQLEAGLHVLNFLGQPAADANYGTFGMKVADSVAPPVVTLAASPTSVTSGQTTTLTWSATGATSCSAAGGWSGSKALTGPETSVALTANTTFEIECVGPGGRDDASVTVTVNAAALRRGGGGAMDPPLLVSLLALLSLATARRRSILR
ncbi:hypothetical protein GCM10011487_62330 [Steroidobacter agaridevorans]|uniref:Ig-like domain-containing protein n=1 Tax=Steroidobacter agaridevorans TaxID=2695856 RepID=A0A829YN40_9GAMM|nr:hypothetical protein [Steroidobacter agaridevorans]GFE84233.1 hypothetical protein GCM10011487_62330 [Steroidobacter agaridevorans]